MSMRDTVSLCVCQREGERQWGQCVWEGESSVCVCARAHAPLTDMWESISVIEREGGCRGACWSPCKVNCVLKWGSPQAGTVPLLFIWGSRLFPCKCPLHMRIFFCATNDNQDHKIALGGFILQGGTWYSLVTGLHHFIEVLHILQNTVLIQNYHSLSSSTWKSRPALSVLMLASFAMRLHCNWLLKICQLLSCSHLSFFFLLCIDYLLLTFPGRAWSR